jgi:hypothetical protein
VDDLVPLGVVVGGVAHEEILEVRDDCH